MRILLLASMLFCLSCVTRKKCAERYPPQIITKDSIVEKENITYRDTTIVVPGDSVQIHDSIPCPDVVYHKTITSKIGKTKASVHINKGRLDVDCKTDSLRAVVDSLVTISKTKELHRTETIIHNVPVIKYRVPQWCWWYIVVTVGFMVWRKRKLIIQLIKKTI